MWGRGAWLLCRQLNCFLIWGPLPALTWPIIGNKPRGEEIEVQYMLVYFFQYLILFAFPSAHLPWNPKQLTVQHRKNDKEDESDEEKISNDIEMKSHGTGDDLKIQIDNNIENSRCFKLNNIDNIGVGTNSGTNVYNIGVGTSSDTNNPLDGNDIHECLRNNEEDEGNETSFSLRDTSADCLF